jgi:hypothetical protein
MTARRAVTLRLPKRDFGGARSYDRHDAPGAKDLPLVLSEKCEQRSPDFWRSTVGHRLAAWTVEREDSLNLSTGTASGHLGMNDEYRADGYKRGVEDVGPETGLCA